MNEEDLHDQALALSALFLAVDGVRKLARTGRWAEANFAALMASVLRRDAATFSDYYPDLSRLARGRDLLLDMLRKGATRQHLYYVMRVIQVEKKLSANPHLMEALLGDLGDVKRQCAHFGLTHETIFTRLDNIYRQTVSCAARKIRVSGNPRYLQQEQVAARVRTLLLCAIRAAALWRASGGNCWQLIFSRQAVTRAALALDLNE